MQVPLAVIADYANVAQGKLNIMGIFDRITARAVPVQHPQMQLVIVLESNPTERGTTKQIGIHLIDADGQEIMRMGGPLPVPAEAGLVQRFNYMVQLNGVVFPHFGVYSFVINVNEEKKADVTFTVAETDQPAPAAG